MQDLELGDLVRVLSRAFDEDLPASDVTTVACVPADAQATAKIVAKAPLTLAGQAVAAQGHHCTGFALARRLYHLAIDSDTPFVDFFGSQRAGFVKTRRPQPFVDSNFVHCCHFDRFARLPAAEPNQTLGCLANSRKTTWRFLTNLT